MKGTALCIFVVLLLLTDWASMAHGKEAVPSAKDSTGSTLSLQGATSARAAPFSNVANLGLVVSVNQVILVKRDRNYAAIAIEKVPVLEGADGRCTTGAVVIQRISRRTLLA
jgi:hypothetical protein